MMICDSCGKCGISWVGDLLNNPSTKCPHCGGENCQRAEPIEEDEPAERCEAGCDEPVTAHDVEGVPLCQACYDQCVADMETI